MRVESTAILERAVQQSFPQRGQQSIAVLSQTCHSLRLHLKCIWWDWGPQFEFSWHLSEVEWPRVARGYPTAQLSSTSLVSLLPKAWRARGGDLRPAKHHRTVQGSFCPRRGDPEFLWLHDGEGVGLREELFSGKRVWITMAGMTGLGKIQVTLCPWLIYS